MSAGLSAAAKAELYAEENSEPWLALLTIEHADFSSTLRYVGDMQSLTSRSNVYSPLAFGVRLPPDREGDIASTIVLDNVDRATIAEIRSVTSDPTITIEVVRRSAPDTVLRSYPRLRMRSAVITADQVQVNLSSDAVFDESYPGLDFTPTGFPAGFNR